MEARQERGWALVQAQRPRIRHIEADIWYVPSESGNGGYLVDGGRCTCPAGQRERCKHAVAIEIIKAGPHARSAAPDEGVPLAPAAPAPAKVPPKGDLTTEEQVSVRAALKHLRAGHGWPALARGLRYEVKTLKEVAYGRLVTASVAVRLARFAGVPVDDVLTGRYPPTCPHCRQKILPKADEH